MTQRGLGQCCSREFLSIMHAKWNLSTSVGTHTKLWMGHYAIVKHNLSASSFQM